MKEDSLPIGDLTIGELRSILRETLLEIGHADAPKGRNLVYGIAGIAQLLGVSRKTAQVYKDTFLAPAVMQNGRKIVVDADLALDLFRRRGRD